MKLYQTDFGGKIKEYGCLFMSLIDVAVETCGYHITKYDIEVIYDKLLKNGCMNQNCWVKNHEITLAVILEHMGSETIMRYSGARYLDTPDDSWGVNEGEYIIVQVKGKNFSHFKRFNYDPYRPNVKFDKILSIRYYKEI